MSTKGPAESPAKDALRRLALSTIAVTLAIESFAELAYAYGALASPIRGVYLVLIAGDPPVLGALAVLVFCERELKHRAAYLVALVAFSTAFVFVAAELLSRRVPALAALGGPAAQHLMNAGEIVGFFATLFSLHATGERPDSPSRKRRVWFAAAACTIARAVAGFVALARPTPLANALVAASAAAMFFSTGWVAWWSRAVE
ncbi:MAG: hypothetical protein U0271_00135 [Polyangiaceae bacterium]